MQEAERHIKFAAEDGRSNESERGQKSDSPIRRGKRCTYPRLHYAGFAVFPLRVNPYMSQNVARNTVQSRAKCI